MTTIANHDALLMIASGKAVLIDVREPAEFYEGYLSGAVNLPSTQFNVEDYREYSDRVICLVCQTDRRAGNIAAQLQRQGLQNVFLLEQQMASLVEGETSAAPAGWSIDRQFRMTLGLLGLTFLMGYFFVSAWFIVIPIILTTGLIITSIIDRCYLRMGIAMLPWNRRRAQAVQSNSRQMFVQPANA
jgi:rhodanese-related sulfurtransferase